MLTPSQELAESLLNACRKWGDSTAVGSKTVDFSYERLASTVQVLSSHISERFDESACMFVPEATGASVVTLFSLLHAGKIPFIADPAWDRTLLGELCALFGIRKLVTGATHPFSETDPSEPLMRGTRAASFLWTLPQVKAEDSLLPTTAFVRFSSGATGRPRALEFSANAAVAASTTWRNASQLHHLDRVLCLASLNNGLAFNTSLLSVFSAGASLHLYEGLLTPGAILREVERVRPTILVGFPFVFELLASQAERLEGSLQGTRLIVSSAAALKVALAEKWAAAAKIPISHYYGIAETGPVTFNPGRSDSSGFPLSGVAIRTSHDPKDPHPIAVRTPYGASRYVPDGNATLQSSVDPDGFFCSNDIGYLDSASGLHVVGRSGRVINIAGRKFSLDDVEAAISRLHGVKELHLHADDSVVTAFVRATDLTVADLKTHCLKVLPPLQVPHRFELVSEIPRSAAGKINFSALQRLSKLANPHQDTP